MEIGFTIATLMLLLFGLLATFDGVYLHLFKYRLYRHKESRFEHITHTIRALLFPFILYFLFLQQTTAAFYAGITFVILDLITLGVDAFVEKDSRAFMGGLPRWEYIIHLFVNGFHFASIAVFLALKLDIGAEGISFRHGFPGVKAFEQFAWLAGQLIPGALLFGVLHVVVMFPKPAALWERLTQMKAANKENL